jgi:hypothetical protein
VEHDGVARQVAGFVARYLPGVEYLHLLVAMAEDAERWWDEPRVARVLGVETADARVLLERLAALNLLEIRAIGRVRYQFRPGSPELRDAALACVDAYRSNPAAVWRMVAATAPR